MQKKFQRRKRSENNSAEGAYTPPPARRKIMDILARRNHSVVELRRKLSLYEYPSEEIEDAINFAEENNWLTAPHELTAQASRSLSRKNKSARYIGHFLRDKGLPAAEVDPDVELEKALSVVSAKLAKESGFDFEEKKKIHRLLTNRGFDSATIRKILDRK